MSKASSEITNHTSKNDLCPQPALLECIAMEGPGIVAIVRAHDLRILLVNKQFEHYFAYTNANIESEELLFTDLIIDQLRDRLTFQLQMVEDDFDARSRYVIYTLKNKRGEPSTYYLYASPIKNDAGINMYYLLMHPNLSKWDMPFTSFNTRELFLEQFNSENFGTFEWVIDVDKVFWSVGIYRIFEIEDKSYVINRFFQEDFAHPDDKKRVSNEIEHLLQTGNDLNIEFKIITAKNKIKTIHTLARIIRSKNGRKLKLTGSIRDVTEQRRTEEDLKNKVEALNHSNRELEEFAYIASHDMQEPLRKITTYSDRLSEKYKDLLSGDGLMYISRMIASADNMRTLINDLLDFSRISKANQLYEKVNLNMTLQQVKNDLELIIEETGTMINSDPLPTVHAIPSQMKQLFSNIIGNGIKFRKPGIPPLINIEINMLIEKEKKRLELPKDRNYYQIAISDNGIGFEDEYNTRIFQVFQRLHGKSEYPGSGIGLAICKKILEHHNGTIYAKGTPDVGAKFFLLLPQDQKN